MKFHQSLLLFLLAAFATVAEAASRVNYKCRQDKLHMVVKLDDDDSDDSFKMLVNIHADSGTYNGWKEVKYLIQAHSSSDDDKGKDDDTTTTTTTSSDEESGGDGNAKSKLRLRVLAADVYKSSGGTVSRRQQCGPITGYYFDCPANAPTTENFNFQILSQPEGLVLDNYFTLNSTSAQSANQTEILVSANWTLLCDNYTLEDDEHFCIEAVVVGSSNLHNSSKGNSLCDEASCVSWATWDDNGQEIVVHSLDDNHNGLRANANLLFCAADGEDIVRWDPTLTLNSGSSLTAAASPLSLLLLLLFF